MRARLALLALAVMVTFGLRSEAHAAPPRLRAPVAIEHATVIPAPGEKIEQATVLIVDGRIAAVGPDEQVALPAGTRRVDGAGLYVYAGFIDGFDRAALAADKLDAADERRREGRFEDFGDGPRVATASANRNGIFADRTVADVLDVEGEETFAKLRSAGFAAGLLAPPRGVVGGRASVVQLGDSPLRESVIREDVCQTASYAPPAARIILARGQYPRTVLGVVAHLRQVLYDARWYAETAGYVQRHPDQRSRLPHDPALAALQPLLGHAQPLMVEAGHPDQIDRTLRLAEEFDLRVAIAGGASAWKAAERLKAADVPVVVTLDLPEKVRDYKLLPEKLSDEADAALRDRAFVSGKAWSDRAFEPKAAYEAAEARRAEYLANAAKLEAAGVRWCFSALDVKTGKDALKALHEIIDAGGLSADAALRGLTVAPAEMFGVEQELGTIRPGRRGNLTILSKPLRDKAASVRSVFVDGVEFEVEKKHATKKDRDKTADKDERAETSPHGVDSPDAISDAAAEPAVETPASESDAVATNQPTTAPSSAPSSQPANPLPNLDLLAHAPDWPIETDAARDPGLHTGGNVLLRNAGLILTVSGDEIPNASLLVQNGKIAAIGPDLAAPDGTTVIDVSGYVLMPGMFDAHSHIALEAVNEFSQAVTCEVRCEDVIVSDDRSIYDALAGGTTTIHAMHGSANPIGGQNVLLKLKYGRPADELVIHDRQRTVKFALGENVIRPGKSDGCACDRTPLRFPATRMGVETTLRRAMFAGEHYAQERDAYAHAREAGEDVPPLRTDLRLAALADIWQGRIDIHTHCYRADEILRLMAVAEDYGLRIAMLHHVLEGYRIMPEILRHGASTATFADWWAYKVEAYDAVPQNAGMLLRAGVNSTIKSDSADLMRHLNHEAAKCMKVSGLTPSETLRLVTLNPAKAFHLDDRVGSLEVGKDADIAVFDGHPLDSFSRCVLTLVEGEVYFRHRDFDPNRPATPRAIKRFAPTPRSPLHDAGIANDTPAHDKLVAALDGKPGAYALTHATVHPVSGAPLSDATLVIADGCITAIGRNVHIPVGASIVDCTGLHVWPGLINAGSSVGLQEVEAEAVTVDTRETGVFQPDIRAVSAVNPHSAMVAIARAEGILTALTLPRSPTIAGQAGLIDLAGWSLPEMLVNPEVALVVNLPSTPDKGLLDEPSRAAFRFWWQPGDDAEKRTREALERIEHYFRDARLYAEALAAAGDDDAALPFERDPRLDALVPYVRGEKPVIFNANRYKAILEALVFADRLGLKPIILGGEDAWKLADLLAATHVPVIYDQVFAMPRGDEPWDANYRAAGVLQRAGVKFCVAQRDASLAKLLPLEIGFAIGHGLEPEAAVRALTLSAAEILGVDDELGSLEVGKRANVIVTTDHVCQATSRVVHAFVDGAPIALETKHRADAERFANRPKPELPAERKDLRGPAPQRGSPSPR